MDKFLSRGLVTAALLAGGGIFYHYVVYLPGLEREKRADEAAKAAAVEVEKEQRTGRYQVCMANAREVYEADWAAACADVAAIFAREHKSCLSDPAVMGNEYMGAQWCDRTWPKADAGPDCTLPGKRSDGVNQMYKDAKERCERELKMGV